MNIRWDIKQGTEEWILVRSQFLSASVFTELVTPTGKASKGKKVTDLENKMIAQIVSGKPIESQGQSFAMRRGHELEPEARSYYEFATGNTVVECGLVEATKISCSPDGLIMSGESIRKGLEIKCPFAHTHVGYVRAGIVPPEYMPQVQGSMMVCGVDEWDFMSYHPDFEDLTITVKRDDEWIDNFKLILEPFLRQVDIGVLELTKKAEK